VVAVILALDIVVLGTFRLMSAPKTAGPQGSC
jgi:hypothetical protein